MVDEQKQALQVAAINLSQEDYGTYITFAIPLNDTPLDKLTAEIDEEIMKIQTELISEREFEKLQNVYENRFVNSNSTIAGIANSLADYHVFYGDTSLINKENEIYKSITREEIREVAKKYLNNNQRVRLEYLPESSK